jgi:hypothetical protein
MVTLNVPWGRLPPFSDTFNKYVPGIMPPGRRVATISVALWLRTTTGIPSSVTLGSSLPNSMPEIVIWPNASSTSTRWMVNRLTACGAATPGIRARTSRNEKAKRIADLTGGCGPPPGPYAPMAPKPDQGPISS